MKMRAAVSRRPVPAIRAAPVNRIAPASTRRVSSMHAPPTDPNVHEPHVAFLDDDTGDAREHGERASSPRDDAVDCTSSTHGPADDTRADEHAGELPPGTSIEPGDY
jgi:hypothetical protein